MTVTTFSDSDRVIIHGPHDRTSLIQALVRFAPPGCEHAMVDEQWRCCFCGAPFGKVCMAIARRVGRA